MPKILANGVITIGPHLTYHANSTTISIATLVGLHGPATAAGQVTRWVVAVGHVCAPFRVSTQGGRGSRPGPCWMLLLLDLDLGLGDLRRGGGAGARGHGRLDFLPGQLGAGGVPVGLGRVVRVRLGLVDAL